MPIYEFVRSGAMKSATLDGKELAFNGPKARKMLTSGEYSVQWFARGNKNQPYTLTAGRPNEKPVKKVDRTLDESRKAAGEFWLEVE